MRIYLASSWRNSYHEYVCEDLRGLGHFVYDFRNPAENGPPTQVTNGFSWKNLVKPEKLLKDPVEHFEELLRCPPARSGFLADKAALEWADACVLLLPCGKSAHLEAGWMIGKGKPCVVLIPKIPPAAEYQVDHEKLSISEQLGTQTFPLFDFELMYLLAGAVPIVRDAFHAAVRLEEMCNQRYSRWRISDILCSYMLKPEAQEHEIDIRRLLFRMARNPRTADELIKDEDYVLRGILRLGPYEQIAPALVALAQVMGIPLTTDTP